MGGWGEWEEWSVSQEMKRLVGIWDDGVGVGIRKIASSFLVFYLLLRQEPSEGDDVGVDLLHLLLAVPVYAHHFVVVYVCVCVCMSFFKFFLGM